ncbi:MAG: hypothetical protein ABH842_03835 [Candidatus Micrarchaeota archaeon]
MEAPFSGKRCVYFETALFIDVGTYTGAYVTSERFFVEINGKNKEIGVPPARLYLGTTFEKEFDPKTAPEKFKRIFNNVFGDDMPEKIIVKEWCLEIEKDYIVNEIEESFYLPPPGPDMDPVEEKYTGYRIMDKEYSKEDKEKMITPASCWTGG